MIFISKLLCHCNRYFATVTKRPCRFRSYIQFLYSFNFGCDSWASLVSHLDNWTRYKISITNRLSGTELFAPQNRNISQNLFTL